ncbi:MAG: hypothetical protein AB8C46_10180 [Burkholderiaceae bacterium]
MGNSIQTSSQQANFSSGQAQGEQVGFSGLTANANASNSSPRVGPGPQQLLMPFSAWLGQYGEGEIWTAQSGGQTYAYLVVGSQFVAMGEITATELAQLSEVNTKGLPEQLSWTPAIYQKFNRALTETPFTDRQYENGYVLVKAKVLAGTPRFDSVDDRSGMPTFDERLHGAMADAGLEPQADGLTYRLPLNHEGGRIWHKIYYTNPDNPSKLLIHQQRTGWFSGFKESPVSPGQVFGEVPPAFAAGFKDARVGAGTLNAMVTAEAAMTIGSATIGGIRVFHAKANHRIPQLNTAIPWPEGQPLQTVTEAAINQAIARQQQVTNVTPNAQVNTSPTVQPQAPASNLKRPGSVPSNPTNRPSNLSTTNANTQQPYSERYPQNLSLQRGNGVRQPEFAQDSTVSAQQPPIQSRQVTSFATAGDTARLSMVKEAGGGSLDLVRINNLIAAGMTPDAAFEFFATGGQRLGDAALPGADAAFNYSGQTITGLSDPARFNFDVEAFFGETKQDSFRLSSAPSLYLNGVDPAGVSIGQLIDAQYLATDTLGSATAVHGLYDPGQVVLNNDGAPIALTAENLPNRVYLTYHQIHPFLGAANSTQEFGAVARLTLFQGTGGDLANLDGAMQGWATELNKLNEQQVNFFANDASLIRTDGGSDLPMPRMRIDQVLATLWDSDSPPPNQALVMSLGVGHSIELKARLDEAYQRWATNPPGIQRDLANRDIQTIARESLGRALSPQAGYDQYLLARAFSELTGVQAAINQALDETTGTPEQRIQQLRDFYMATPVPDAATLNRYIEDVLKPQVSFEQFSVSYGEHMRGTTESTLGGVRLPATYFLK